MEYPVLVNVKIKSVIQTHYELKQQDYGQKIIVTAEDYDINDTTARLFINKNDGTVNERIMTKENDSYIYILDSDDTSCPGKTVFDVKYYKQGVRDSSASFIFNIIPDRFGNLIESKDFSDSLQGALDDVYRTKEIIDEYDEKIEKINTAAATAENAASTSVIAVSNCEQATNKANVATDRANTAAATAEGIAENKTGINDNTIGASTTWSSNKINTSLANQIGTASGASINLPNSFNGGLLLNELQGKSVQNGTPSPTNKVDIVSVGDNGSVVVRVTGKNLLKSNAVSTTLNGVTYTVNSDKTINATGTRTSTTYINILGNLVDKVVVFTFIKGLTYYAPLTTISYKNLDGVYSNIPKGSYFKPTEDILCTGIYIEVTSLMTLPLTLYPMLCLNDGTTTYEPYKEQLITIPLTQPLRSVGSVYDRIIKKNGVWGIERNYKEKIVDKSNVTYIDNLTNVSRCRISLENSVPTIIASDKGLITDKLQIKDGYVLDEPHTYIFNSSLFLFVPLNWFNTDGNYIKAVYRLATPTFEPLSQSLQDQLNKLQTYQGVTNIFTTDALQPTISVSYGKTDASSLALYGANVSDNKVDKSSVANNLITTVEGTFLDGRQGKALSDKIGNLSDLKTEQKTDLVGSVNEVKASVDEVNNNLDKVIHRRIIFVGDSYSEGYVVGQEVNNSNWMDNAISFMNDTTQTYYKCQKGGTAFGDTRTEYTFLQALKDWESVVADKSIITDIIVCGGRNDFQFSLQQILSGISAFTSYCRVTYPNAKVHIGMMGGYTEAGYVDAARQTVEAYSWCAQNGACFINNLQYTLRDSAFMSVDNIHPNEFGQQMLGKNVANYIKNGNVSTVSNLPSSTGYFSTGLTPLDSAESNKLSLMQQRIDGFVKIISISTAAYNLPSSMTVSCNGSEITLGQLTRTFIVGSASSIIGNYIPVIYYSSDGTYHTVMSQIYIKNNSLILKSIQATTSGFESIANVTRLYIPPFAIIDNV